MEERITALIYIHIRKVGKLGVEYEFTERLMSCSELSDDMPAV